MNIYYFNLIHQGILCFWGLWFTLVAVSDFANILQKVKVLSENFAFSSKNYDLIVNSLIKYNIASEKISIFMFSLVTIWAFLIAFLFWMALFVNSALKYHFSNLAFLVSFLMTGCFILWDEIFIQYDLEHGHMLRLLFQIITFILFLNVGIYRDKLTF